MTITASLSKPATLADVLGWACAIPMLAWAVMAVPAVYPLPAKFEDIYVNFDATVPWTTRFFLDVGGLGLAVGFGVLALAPVVVLFLSNRPWPKLIAPIACAVTTLLLHAAIVQSLFVPIEQMMQVLTGGAK